MRRLRRACGAALAVLAAAGTLTLPAVAGPGTAPTPTEVARSPFSAASPSPAVVVVGVPGLRWSDIQGEIPTPGLWLLARDSALGAMAVRTVEPTACAMDGWLTLNSGARAIGPRPDGNCAPVPAPQSTGSSGGGAGFPDWAELVAPNADHSYDPVWGTLAGARADSTPMPDNRRCAIGPGAALALADGQGRVRATYAADLAGLGAGDCADLLVIDAGLLPLGQGRLDAVRTVDRLVTELRAALPDSALMVAGLADSDPDRAHLGALMVDGGEQGLRGLRRGWLRSESTRRTGLVTITDLTPTLAPAPVPADLDGNALQYRARIESTPAAVREMERRDIAAQVVLDVFVPFFVVLIGGQLLLYLAAGLALRGGRVDRRGCARLLALVGLGFGAAPAATVLANLLPWRAAGHPAPTLWVIVLAGSVAIAALARTGPWRRHPYGPAAAISLITGTALGLDVMLGSRLQLNSLFGLSPLIAGRFYGFGNIAFAVFAVCALVTAAGGAAYLVRHGRLQAAGALVLVLGGLAALVDGWPDFGADFGGVLSLLPGVAVLAAGVSGVRITPWRVLDG